MAHAPSRPPEADGTQVWCAGLPFRRTRHLSGAERAALYLRIRRTRRRLLAAGAVLLAVVVGVGVAIGAAAPQRTEGADLWAGLVVLAWAGVVLGTIGGASVRKRLAFAAAVVLLTAIPLADVIAGRMGLGSLSPILWDHLPSLYTAISLLGLYEIAVRVRQKWTLARALSAAERELSASDVVWVFGGPDEAHDRAAAWSGAAPLPRIEVLPRSELFVRGPAGLPPRLALAPIRRLAPPRPFALRVPIPGARAQDPNLRVQRRSLSPEERSELSGQAGRLRRNLGPVLASYAACIVQLAADAFVWGRTGNDVWFSAGATFWYAVAAATSLVYVQRLRAAQRLDRDAGHPWIVSIDSADASPAEGVPHMEVLPVSRLIWTEHGRPAAWRFQRS